jgi:hypothetical protein
MRYKNYLTEKKWLQGTMIGFVIPPSKLQRIYEYIESWLKRYKIPYEKQEEPHFTIAQIPGEYEKDELMRSLNSLDMNIKFNPKGITIFRGVNVPKDFIVLEYKANQKFIDAFKEIASEYKVRKFPDIRPHTSIFIVEKNAISKKMLKQMKFSLPKLPFLSPVEIALWNNKYEIEATTK